MQPKTLKPTPNGSIYFLYFYYIKAKLNNLNIIWKTLSKMSDVQTRRETFRICLYNTI